MVKIQFGKYGYFLLVDGYCIKRNPISVHGIKITKIVGNAKNWYATEFASIKELREFWNHNKIVIQLLTRLTDEH
jgi:hypothetical protein